MNFLFHPAARVEHLDHVRYYEQIRPGLGAQYLTDFDETMRRVCEPNSVPRIVAKFDRRHVVAVTSIRRDQIIGWNDRWLGLR